LWILVNRAADIFAAGDNSDFVVLCFSNPEDGEAFAELQWEVEQR
jgi:hypothetical protein